MSAANQNHLNWPATILISVLVKCFWLVGLGAMAVVAGLIEAPQVEQAFALHSENETTEEPPACDISARCDGTSQEYTIVWRDKSKTGFEHCMQLLESQSLECSKEKDEGFYEGETPGEYVEPPVQIATKLYSPYLYRHLCLRSGIAHYSLPPE